MLSPSYGQVTHVLLTRSPLIHPLQAEDFIVRLACIRHTASVRPEPGSNSRFKFEKLIVLIVDEPCSSDSCLDPIKNRRPLHIWLILLCSVFKDLLLYKMSLRLSATFLSYHVVNSVSTLF